VQFRGDGLIPQGGGVTRVCQGRLEAETALTDGGSESKGEFEEACRKLRVEHTSTKPWHAWTNCFVERVEGTIPREHWRVAFRRDHFTEGR